MKKLKFDTRLEYIAHLGLILIFLFLSYYLGNAILNFAGSYSILKMFGWFFIIFYFADNIAEYLLKV